MDSLKIVSSDLGRLLDIPAPGVAAGAPGAGGPAAGVPAQVPFADLLKQAVGAANELSQKSDAMNQALVEGRAVDLHRVVLAQQEAQIAFDLVQQMRDKIVSAYQEVLRMPM